MTEQAKNILLSAAAEIETMYNQGILDGITLIRNMLDENPDENTVWTPELIKETCDAFIMKYTSSDDSGNVRPIPEIPNMVEEIPQEYKDAGMSQEAYSDLMSFLDTCSETEYEVEEPVVGTEIIPLSNVNAFIEEPDSDMMSYAHNNIVPFPNMFPQGSELVAIPNANPNDVIDIVELPDLSYTTPVVDDKCVEPSSIMLDVMENAIIQTESGEEIKLADCIAETVEEN